MAEVWLAIWLTLSAWGAGCNVFGPDDRRQMPLDTPLSLAMGKVIGNSVCTGTLVGERLVLTAAHCVNWHGSDLSPTYQTIFLASERGGLSPATNLPKAIEARAGSWRGDADPRSEDWAVLVLEAPPRRPDGTPFPWVDVAAVPLSAGQPIASAGYSFDVLSGSSPYFQENCKVQETFSDGEFFHDCDGAAGSSGGPLLLPGLNPRIIALTNAHRSDGTSGLHLPAYQAEHANVAVSATNFIGAVLDLRRRFPAPP